MPTYAYALNNPVNVTDPDGKAPIEPICLAAAVVMYAASGAHSRSDPVRHCTASCYMTKLCGGASLGGSGTAASVGGFKEFPIDEIRRRRGTSVGPDPIDLKHDGIGIACGLGALGAPTDPSKGWCAQVLQSTDCMQCCLANIPPGELNH